MKGRWWPGKRPSSLKAADFVGRKAEVPCYYPAQFYLQESDDVDSQNAETKKPRLPAGLFGKS
ncbi:hypothetical protein ALO62_200065 [Pseudomonas amygdali pv. myricae]|uniref:Uncharacterized protein n=1 Tax=Pseudomonas syringae pv. theae TaxID=103985 RepID=A0A3M5M9H9_PSESX|nr:hypothetical protein ALO62_200065 [Pseudomonas amygdali pv. myricae]RMT55703.1 hypothetical protein ALP44_200059 [Pseudomonas syringae pv. theae]RMV22969.1 hypothetical protein ALP14_200046 [Pseudomonas amygdali pv. myricae]